MAHGSRSGARRLLLATLGLVIGTGLVGCMDKDPKPVGYGKQPGPGLPGTPMVTKTGVGAPPPGAGYAGQGSWNGQQSGMQPAAGRSMTGTGVQPAAGYGAGAGYASPAGYNTGGAAGYGTGAAGYGSPAAGTGSNVIPAVTPPAGAAGSGWQGSAVTPTSTRGQSPDPAQLALTEFGGPLPPPMPAGVAPAVTPVSPVNAPSAVGGPIAPPATPPGKSW